jgi:hypothetical protein
MSADRTLIRAGISGSGTTGCELLYVAPVGTTAPTDTASSTQTNLNASFLTAGLVTDDGVSLGISESVEKVKAFGTNVSVRSIIKESEQTFDVTFLETNPTVLELYHRKELGTIIPDGDGKFSIPTGLAASQVYAFALDVLDDENAFRFYYPSAEITDRKERKIGNGQVIQYTITVTAYPGTDGIACTEFYTLPDLAGS